MVLSFPVSSEYSRALDGYDGDTCQSGLISLDRTFLSFVNCLRVDVRFVLSEDRPGVRHESD